MYNCARPVRLRMAHSIALFSDSVSSAFISLRVLSKDPMSNSASIPFFVVVFLSVAVMSSNRRICLLKWWLRLFTSLYMSMMYRMKVAIAVKYRPAVAAESSGDHGNAGSCSGVGGSGMSEMMYEIRTDTNTTAQMTLAIMGRR